MLCEVEGRVVEGKWWGGCWGGRGEVGGEVVG